MASIREQNAAIDHALALIEDRGVDNALAWASHCAARDRSGFWRLVVKAIERESHDPMRGCPANL
jgi:hypothetical protein